LSNREANESTNGGGGRETASGKTVGRINGEKNREHEKRKTASGERGENTTEWAIFHYRDHLGSSASSPEGKRGSADVVLWRNEGLEVHVRGRELQLPSLLT